MYNVKDDIFDAILTTAFNEYLDIELSQMPSDEELAAMYPIPEKQVRKMQKYAKRLKHHISMPVVYLRRFAVACLVIISLTFAALATSPVVREAIKNTVVTWYEKYVQFDFAKADDSQNEITDIYELDIGYIPNRFELVDSKEEKNRREYTYCSFSSENIQIIIRTSQIANYYADIELSEYEEIRINGQSSYIVYNAEEKYGTLIFGNDIYTVRIMGSSTREELINIAEQIKQIN